MLKVRKAARPIDKASMLALHPATATPSKDLVLPYSGAHFGKSLFWYASEAFIAFLLTEVLRLPASSIAWTLSTSFLFSAVLDVAVGTTLRQRLASVAYAGRLQFVGSFVSAIAMTILFALPLLRLKASYAVVVLAVALFRAAYALIDIPQNAILSTSTKGEEARVRLASARLAASGLAALTISGLVSTIIYQNPAFRPISLVAVALSIGATAIGTSLLLRRALDRPDATPPPLGLLQSVARSGLPGEAWLLLTAMFLTTFAAPVFAKLLPFYAAYRLPDPAIGTTTIAAVSLGMVFGQPLLLKAIRRLTLDGKISAMALATSAGAALFAVADAAGAWAIPLSACLFGACSGGLGAALWAAYADVIARRLVGREGLAFGLLTASAKVSLAVSGIGIGWLLGNPVFRSGKSGLLLNGMTIPAIVAGLAVMVVLVALRRPGARVGTLRHSEKRGAERQHRAANRGGVPVDLARDNFGNRTLDRSPPLVE